MQVNNVSVNQRPEINNNESIEPILLENRRLTRAEFEQELNDWANNVDISTREDANWPEKISLLWQIYECSDDEGGIVVLNWHTLTSLPAVFGEFQSLSSLTLNMSKLAEFPKITCPMPNIETLKISCGDDLKALPENLSELFPNLTCLDCQGSSGLVINASQITGLHDLIELNLAGTATEFSALLGELPRLHSLIHNDGTPRQDYRRLTRTEFEQELNDWANSVDISTREDANWPEKISLLWQIYECSDDEGGIVVLNWHTLTSLPAVFGEFHSLTHLELKMSKLAEFPKITCPMPNIETLKINCGGDLKALPANFSKLFPNLIILDCQGSSGLVINASQITGLHDLIELNLAGTATDIAALLRKAPRLHRLIQNDGAPRQRFADYIEQWRRDLQADLAAIFQVHSKLAQIPPSPIWPKEKFDDYIKKILGECVPRYLSGDAVLQVLDAALADPVLANRLFVLALKSDLARCLDNRLRTFHDMQVTVEIAAALVKQQQEGGAQPQILLKVLSGHYRNYLLSAFAKEIAGKSSELLEVELFLRYRLKKSLNLACPIKDMLHKKLAEEMITRLITASGESVRLTLERVLSDAQNFVFDREKDQAAWALWLVGDPNWLIWLEQKCEVNLKRLESQLQQEIEGVDKEFAQLPLTAQDEQLVDSAERKQRLEEEFKKDKFEYLLDVTNVLISQSGVN